MAPDLRHGRGGAVTVAAICRLNDLPEPGSAGFVVDVGGAPVLVMVVRAEGQVWAYRNLCPHRALPLDARPGQFLDPDRRHIRCANHGALFRIADGLCLAGPCAGQRLTPVSVAVAGGMILTAPPLPVSG